MTDAERLARAVLLLHASTWTPQDHEQWTQLTNAHAVTVEVLCRLARRVLAEEGTHVTTQR